MDRLLTRRGVLIGAGAVAIAPMLPDIDLASALPSPVVRQPATPRIRGFVLGTGQRPLGAAIDLVILDRIVSFDVNPMSHKSEPGPLTSDDPAVVAFLQAVSHRLWVETYQSRTFTSKFKAKRKPGVRGEWIQCPDCRNVEFEDCESCWGRGSVWRNF